MDTKTKLSTLWIVVIFNMVFADILSFMIPDFLHGLIDGSAENINITQELLLIFAIMIEIPIAMILLSKELTYSLNRRLNIIFAIITMLFVIGGGSLSYHYLFFATVEIICLVSIVLYAYRWKKTE